MKVHPLYTGTQLKKWDAHYGTLTKVDVLLRILLNENNNFWFLRHRLFRKYNIIIVVSLHSIAHNLPCPSMVTACWDQRWEKWADLCIHEKSIMSCNSTVVSVVDKCYAYQIQGWLQPLLAHCMVHRICPTCENLLCVRMCTEKRNEGSSNHQCPCGRSLQRAYKFTWYYYD